MPLGPRGPPTPRKECWRQEEKEEEAWKSTALSGFRVKREIAMEKEAFRLCKFIHGGRETSEGRDWDSRPLEARGERRAVSGDHFEKPIDLLPSWHWKANTLPLSRFVYTVGIGGGGSGVC